MADVKVNEGAGPRIDTVEVVGDDAIARHQQVVQVATGKVALDSLQPNPVSSAAAVKVAQGKFFIGGAAISLGGLASTERAAFRIFNPSTSGKVIYIAMITLYSSITQQVKYNEGGTIIADGTITPQNWNRAMATPPASVVELTHTTSSITGGTDWPNESRIFNTSPLPLNFSNIPLPIGPGKSFLVRGTVSDAQIFTVNAYWYEEPIA